MVTLEPLNKIMALAPGAELPGLKLDSMRETCGDGIQSGHLATPAAIQWDDDAI
jgi:hypothetical protein